MADVVAQHPGWDPTDPRQPAQISLHGFPCGTCTRMLARSGRRCQHHISTMEARQRRLLREQDRAAWAGKKKAYQNLKRALNHRNRLELLKPDTKCGACNVRPENVSHLHLEHKVPVAAFVRRDIPIERAYVTENVWFLCRECHNVKTKGIRAPPPIEHLAKTNWGLLRSKERLREDYAAWQASARERQRRAEMIDLAMAKAPAPVHLLGD